MYGQNLGGRPDAPGEPIFTKFCMRVSVPDVFLSFEFQKDRMKNVGDVGVEISPLPLKRHIAYTTACCYRTSRDIRVLVSYIYWIRSNTRNQYMYTTGLHHINEGE